jgi:type VI secretion system VasD/TssJ family lipoprotein
MAKHTKVIVALVFLFLIGGCASKPVPPPDYSYGKDAINISLHAASELNVYQGVPHTLLVCVYQLKDRTAYNQLVGKKNGLYQLLRGQKFDPSVTYSEKIIMHPGTDKQLVLDRAEGTKYLAVVTGYYSMSPEKMTKVFDIPVALESEGPFSMSKVNVVKDIDVSLTFGAERIQ